MDVDQSANDLQALKERLADTVRRYDELSKQYVVLSVCLYNIVHHIRYEEVLQFLEDERLAEEERRRIAAENERKNHAAYEIQGECNVLLYHQLLHPYSVVAWMA